MTTEEIKEFVDQGLLTHRILRESTGLTKGAISNRLKNMWKFRDNEIDYLRILYFPLFKKLFPDLVPRQLHTKKSIQHEN